MQENTARQKSWFASCMSTLFIVGIFLLIGAGLTYWGWNILQTARASEAWPAVDGIITASDVSHSTDAEGGETYSPEITYRYQVDTVSYENGTIKFGENAYSSRREAEQIAAGYPVGRDVTVYYNPDQPDRSVLEPGVSGGSYIVLGIGVLFLVITLIIAPFAFFRREAT